MQRIVFSAIFALILLVSSVSAGMTSFAMHGGAGEMAAHPTESAAIPDCLDLCLAAVASFRAPVALVPFGAVLLLLAFAVAVSSDAAVTKKVIVHRWREGIGKILLRQELATVILRN